jgi:hypothetical protein
MMTYLLKKLILTGIAALFLATGAAHTETNVLGCFVRTYDKAHLARHPDQLVTAVKLHIYHPPPGVGTPPLKEAEAKNATWMKMEVKVRGRDVILTIGAICHKGAAPATGWTFACSVDCDGGGIGVVSRDDHAMMYLDRIRMGVKSYSCGDESTEDLLGNKDDRVFCLNRVNERDCADMEP